jgi:ABC-type sugar transport system substrate-binding protein
VAFVRKKGIKFGILLASLSLALAACSSSSTTSSSSSGKSSNGTKKLKMAGILMQSDVEWFKYIQMGMEDAAKKYNVDLTIGNANMQVTDESNLVDTYASQGMDAVMLSALDTKASAPAIKRAEDKGVKVVDYNTNVDPSVQKYFVGIDNTKLGAQAGKALVDYVEKNMNGKAKVAMVTLSMFEVGKQREQGFMSEVKKDPGIQIVAKADASNPQDGANVTETMLQGHPDVDLVWGANEGGAVGAVVGVKSKGLDNKIKIFGTDMSIQTGKYILDSKNPYYYVSTQQPYEIGYKSVEVAVKAVKGQKPAAETIVPLDSFSKADTNKIQQYLDKYKNLN